MVVVTFNLLMVALAATTAGPVGTPFFVAWLVAISSSAS
jgi:hypothetical protein